MQTEEGRNGEEEEAGPEGKDDYLFGRGPSVIYFMPHQSEYLAKHVSVRKIVDAAIIDVIGDGLIKPHTMIAVTP